MKDKTALILIALSCFTIIGIAGMAAEILDTNEEFALFTGFSFAVLVYFLTSYHTRRTTDYEGY